MKTTGAKISLASSMLIFGTIGIFVHYINMPSGAVAFVRGVLGTLFLIATALVTKKLPDKKAIKANLPHLITSGMCIGVNWILLFESYRFTTVAASTLCYYLAPIFVIIVSPFLFGEKLGVKKIVCVISALVGMVFVSGVLTSGFSGLRGILLAIGAAVFYASVILMNKKIHGITPSDKTTVQLAAAALIVLPYSLIAEPIGEIELKLIPVILLLIVGIIHTGLAYTLYFGSLSKLPSTTIALFSYIDPIFAVVLSALLLRQPMDIYMIIGALLILGATMISEFELKKK